MDIKIYSLQAIKKALLARELMDYDVLSIRDSNASRMFYHEIDVGTGLRKRLVITEMDDIRTPHDLLEMPTRPEVERILNCGISSVHLAVHCSAGVSRSSAFAYLLACQAEGPEKAITLLNENLHWPNMLIVSLGASILGNPEVAKVCSKWKRKTGHIRRRSE